MRWLAAIGSGLLGIAFVLFAIADLPEMPVDFLFLLLGIGTLTGSALMVRGGPVGSTAALAAAVGVGALAVYVALTVIEVTASRDPFRSFGLFVAVPLVPLLGLLTVASMVAALGVARRRRAWAIGCLALVGLLAAWWLVVINI